MTNAIITHVKENFGQQNAFYFDNKANRKYGYILLNDLVFSNFPCEVKDGYKVLAWALCCLHPSFDFLPLHFFGETGAGKTAAIYLLNCLFFGGEYPEDPFIEISESIEPKNTGLNIEFFRDFQFNEFNYSQIVQEIIQNRNVLLSAIIKIIATEKVFTALNNYLRASDINKELQTFLVSMATGDRSQERV